MNLSSITLVSVYLSPMGANLTDVAAPNSLQKIVTPGASLFQNKAETAGGAGQGTP